MLIWFGADTNGHRLNPRTSGLARPAKTAPWLTGIARHQSTQKLRSRRLVFSEKAGNKPVKDDRWLGGLTRRSLAGAIRLKEYVSRRL
jgi:hypothetical protein